MTTQVSKEFMRELRLLRNEWMVMPNNALALATLIAMCDKTYSNINSYISDTYMQMSNERLYQVIEHVTNVVGDPVFEEEKKYYVAKVNRIMYYTGAVSNRLKTTQEEYWGVYESYKSEALTDEDIEFLQKRFGSESVELIEVK
ncbi:hypothetical protein pwc_50 [Weissella phage PWc]|nr:hypothetical protein pwc_50 [Weissella phage PWc]